MFEMNPYALEPGAMPEAPKPQKERRIDRIVRFLERMSIPAGFMTSGHRPVGVEHIERAYPPQVYDRDTINNMIAFDPYHDPSAKVESFPEPDTLE
jgi:hypothetical protein